ncbi:MAG: DNA recombination protein RmuC [Candidatus Saccharibacteria bacterium]|nr:DNA recombination protein RmuC [Candidatus Saccharibacteria bacterium]
MEIGLIVAGLVVLAVVLVVAIYFFAQKFTLQLTKVNEDQRKESKEEIESDVKNIFNEITKGIEKQLAISREEMSALKNQNTAITEQLKGASEVTKELHTSTENLKKVLSNNQLRGRWGEEAAEQLLMSAGFVVDETYIKQRSSGEGRPDFTILLPDKTKLNVDVKFPYNGLMDYQEAKTKKEREAALKKFKSDVKEQAKSITSKDYIDPQNNTLDFVIMFIPNEMIFSFIYDQAPELKEFCDQNKVVLAGPFGFTAILRLIFQAYKNFGYEKNLQEILGLVNKFQEEYDKFGDHMQKLGNQLATAQKTFTEVEGTRNRQLTKVVDQIQAHSESQPLKDTEEIKKLGEKNRDDN